MKNKKFIFLLKIKGIAYEIDKYVTEAKEGVKIN